jgi:hypothetical protein
MKGDSKMNPSIRKELEDSANPACNRYVTQSPDGETWAVVTEHPSLGIIDEQYGFDTIAEAELVLESMSITDADSDVDLEIELSSGVFDTVTDSEYLANNRDVPSRVELGPCLTEGGRPLMRLVREENTNEPTT